jgi:tetratricopeptide (TPR) repeat protein
VSFPTGLEPPPVADPPRDGDEAEPVTQALSEGPARPTAPADGGPAGRAGARTAVRLALGLAAAIVAAALLAKGGASLGAGTLVYVLLTLAGAAVAAAAALTAPTPWRRWGSAALLALAALTAWTAVSVVWSVIPDRSWAEANRAIAYLAVFAGGVGAARLWPRRPGAILAGVLIGAGAISAIALALKAYPLAFNSTEELARMRDPLDYWNALGLLAAFAIPPCLWLGARRDGPPALRALAYPLLGLAVVVVALSYSRGALIAVVAGLAFWFALVPLRLRGTVVAMVGGGGGVAVAVWAFAQDALSKDRAPLAQRVDAGGDLAMLCVLMLAVLFAAGLAIARYGDRRPLPEHRRRQAGLGLLGTGLVALVACAVALSATGGGPGARAERAWDNFFSKSKTSTTYGPERLKSIGTRRGSYWDDAAQVWEAHPILGAGAGGYAVARKRYRDEPVEVQRAHGYVPQTAADLGAVGLGLSLLFALALGLAAARTLGSRRTFSPRALDPRRLPAGLAGLGRRASRIPAAAARLPGAAKAAADRAAPRRPVDGDRVAILTLLTLVVTFAVHSLIDWTWLVPAAGVVVLACAGYVAGRGPLGVPGPERGRPLSGRIASAGLLAGIALAGTWAIWQPLRSERASDAALASLGEGRPPDAAVQAQAAHERNPLALRPLFDLASIHDAAGRRTEAQRALEDAVRLQPANPDSWSQLATYQLNVLNQPTVAFQSARAALFLDPKSPATQSLFLDAYRKLPRRPVTPGADANPNPILDELSKLGK